MVLWFERKGKNSFDPDLLSDNLFNFRSCYLCGDYAVCGALSTDDIFILQLLRWEYESDKEFNTIRKFRQRFISSFISDLRTAGYKAYLMVLNKLVQRGFLLKQPIYRIISPYIRVQFQSLPNTFSFIKFREHLVRITGVLNISFDPQTITFHIYFNSDILDTEKIISVCTSYLGCTPKKVNLFTSCYQSNYTDVDIQRNYRIIHIALNPSNHINFNPLSDTPQKRITINNRSNSDKYFPKFFLWYCPAFFSSNTYRVLKILYRARKPLTFSALAIEANENEEIIEDILFGLEALAVVLQITDNDTSSTYVVNYTHPLININPYIE